MQMTTFSPSSALAPFVEKFSIVESHEEVTRALLPDLGLILGLRFAGAAHQGDTRLPDAAMTGVQASARHVRTAAGSGIVLAHFRPGGAAACFRMSLHELFGTTVPLDALLGGAEVERARDRIASAPTHAARVAIVEALLVARAHDAAIDRMAVEAVRRIETAGGRLRISDLARDLGITHDPLEKRFRRAIGASPKQLAMLVRIRRAIALATARRERVGLARIALDAGYFDQSHFNRELRAVTGASPTQFFGDTAYC